MRRNRIEDIDEFLEALALEEKEKKTEETNEAEK